MIPSLLVRNKLILIGVGIVFFLGSAFGVILNLTTNQKPAPNVSNAAATPTPTKTPTSTPSPKPTLTPTPTPSYLVQGHIFIDNNANGKENAEDSNYTLGATLSASLNNTPINSVVSTNTGKFTLGGFQNGNYIVSLVIPDGYRLTTDNNMPETVTNANVTGVTFGIVPSLWNIPSGEKFVMCRDLKSFVHDHCE